ncbi:hypothetical protein [uncultured Desulfobacter sp.]|uniref:hypothetical protein n=1 Tax=uncultured Desulfobacter sp. TaxID=240139 RepID=UPI002AAAF3E9|nr:hypothetical protein [uncultured Desulfobacter sp.]
MNTYPMRNHGKKVALNQWSYVIFFQVPCQADHVLVNIFGRQMFSQITLQIDSGLIVDFLTQIHPTTEIVRFM